MKHDFGIQGLIEFLKATATRAEGRWFDATRHVRTEGFVAVAGLALTGAGQSGNDYLPIRPSVGRQVLAHLPIQDLEEYTFVDLGSGKGRMLLVAAEYPFRKIRGVEFAIELQREAEQNLSSFSIRGQRCRDLESVNVDAAEYFFSDEQLVLYINNSFGLEILRKVFSNLEKSIRDHPRHVVVLMVTPQLAYVADAMPFLRLYYATRRFRVYQTVSS